jgi:hypothetical protein
MTDTERARADRIRRHSYSRGKERPDEQSLGASGDIASTFKVRPGGDRSAVG